MLDLIHQIWKYVTFHTLHITVCNISYITYDSMQPFIHDACQYATFHTLHMPVCNISYNNVQRRVVSMHSYKSRSRCCLSWSRWSRTSCTWHLSTLGASLPDTCTSGTRCHRWRNFRHMAGNGPTDSRRSYPGGCLPGRLQYKTDNLKLGDTF